MKERPILFSSEMVRAILEGRKTQTRRALRRQFADILPMRGEAKGKMWATLHERKADIDDQHGSIIRCPYGQLGDRLWVREAWAGDEWTGVAYKATEPNVLPFGEEVVFKNWKPSIHMPRWASRITLEIVNVRVERVQDIKPIDCVAEGAYIPPHFHWGKQEGPEAIKTFSRLWDSINAKRGFGWDVNPWVWVIEFKRLAEQG